VLVDLADIGEVAEVTYDGEVGAVIAIDGKLYVNIPVAENSAEPASAATVSDWSLLEPDTTVVLITAESGEKYMLTATTAEQVAEP